MPAKILFADDNSITRKTLRSFLGSHSFQIYGQDRRGKEGVAKIRRVDGFAAKSAAGIELIPAAFRVAGVDQRPKE